MKYLKMRPQSGMIYWYRFENDYIDSGDNIDNGDNIDDLKRNSQKSVMYGEILSAAFILFY
jgi:hypothetical protein